MFDAGAIMAHVDIDTGRANTDLDRLEQRVRGLEQNKHHIRLDAVFDDASVSHARQVFAQLDQVLSRDAANRLRSSPQGSVLGALNALFSPHQITGSPSPTQSAQQGQLGRMAQGQAAALGTMPGAPQQRAAQQQNERINRTITTDITDRTRESSMPVVMGGGGSGGRNRFHIGIGSGGPFFGMSHSFGGGGGGAVSGVAGGIGPSILGMGLRTAGIVGGAGSLLGALPGALGPLAGLGVGGLGLGVAGLGAKLLIGSSQSKGPLYAAAQEFGKDFRTTFAQAAQPLAADLKGLFATLPGILHSLQPLLRGLFASAGTLIGPAVKGLVDLAHMVLPLLGQAFRAAAPLMRPLIDGLGKLVAGILPGLTAIIRASAPVVREFAGILGNFGKDIGGLFAAMAPAVKASEPIFRALMQVIGALFPIIGKVAGEFAKVLGPVFVSLAKTITQLLPILKPVGMLIAQLAAAILGDLGSAFQAVLILVRDMEPSIRILAGALGSVFKVLENSGVFAMFGDTLEQVAPVLAQLVNTLVRGFAPILPVIIQLMARFSEIMVSLMAVGLKVVLSGITDLLTKFPLLSKLLLIGAAAWGVLTLAMNVNPVVAIASAILALIGVVTLLVTHWHQVWSDIKHWASDAWQFIWNGFGKFLLPLLGPVGLIALGAVELARHWRQVTGMIQDAAQNLWQWLWNDFGAKILNFFTNTIPGWWDRFVNLTNDNLIKPFEQGLSDLWQWVWNDFGQKIINFFVNTLPNKFGVAVNAIGDAWNAVKKAVAAPVNFVLRYVVNDGLIKAFDWISSKVGGPHISDVPLIGMQKGGKVPGGYGGGDKMLIAAEPGETVVPKEHSAGLSWLWKSLGIPGYQHGGTVGNKAPVNLHTGVSGSVGGAPFGGGIISDIENAWKKVYDVGRITAALASGNTTALTNAFYALMGHRVGGATGDLARLLTDVPKTLVKDAIKDLLGLFSSASGSGSGAQIVQYAMQYLGKIPYIFGGTSLLTGDDCSGFTQAVYRHFGYNAPRTSEEQGAWVKRGAPVSGGLAFFNSPAGGSPPGHVGIVIDGSRMISQAGPEGKLGPSISSYKIPSLMWTGTPPGGLLPGFSAKGRYQLSGLEHLWSGAGNPGNPHIAGAIALAESGGDPRIVQKGQPYGTTGWGLWQITPGDSEPQFGINNALLNPLNNARAAGAKYRQAGNFTPWTTFTSGIFGRFMDSGGWLEPGPNLSFNATRGREAVLTPAQSRAFIEVGEAARLFTRGMGNTGTGRLMRDVYLTLPEGSTVAQAMTEITFRLRTAQQNGFAGVITSG